MIRLTPESKANFIPLTWALFLYAFLGVQDFFMNRIAVTSIIIEDKSKATAINDILSQYGQYMVGRMGIPYKTRGINIISVVLDAPNNVISAMSGKLGALSGVTSKTIYSKEFPDE